MKESFLNLIVVTFYFRTECPSKKEAKKAKNIFCHFSASRHDGGFFCLLFAFHFFILHLPQFKTFIISCDGLSRATNAS